MPWCENCKEEYREGFVLCTECGGNLIAEVPKENHVGTANNYSGSINPCLLISISDGIQLSVIEELLEQSNIPFYKKDKECGTYLKIYMGYSVFGTDIYVDESNYNEAKNLVDTYQAEFVPENEEIPLKEKDNRSFFVRKTIMKIFLICMVISFCISILMLIYFAILGSKTQNVSVDEVEASSSFYEYPNDNNVIK